MKKYGCYVSVNVIAIITSDDFTRRLSSNRQEV